MEPEKPESAPATPAISAEAPKKRPWLTIAVIVVVIAVIVAAVAYVAWPRNRPPTISQSTVSSSIANVGDTLTFTGQASDPDGNPLTYAWNFGDGTTGTGTTATHSFTLPGRFIALLTVTDGQGGEATNDNKLIFIQVQAPRLVAPTAQDQTGPALSILTADKSVIQSGTKVSFNGNSSWAYIWSWANASDHSKGGSYDPTFPAAGGAAMFDSLTYNWGDGSTATTGTEIAVGKANHTFSSAGHFFVKLTVAITGPSGTQTAASGYTIRVLPAAPAKQVKNPDIVTEVTFGEPDYMDPATDYETAGGEVLQNVYETLVWYQEGSASTSILVPRLATDIPTVANGGISADGMNYTFHLRSGVKFHDGTTMTADDVVYSIQRILWIHDPNGPSWMMEQIMTNYISYYAGLSFSSGPRKGLPYNISDWVGDNFASNAAVPLWMKAVLPAESTWATTRLTVPMGYAVSNASVVKVDASTVKVLLTHPYPAFLYIAAYTIMSIVPKAVVLAHLGDSWGNHNTWMDSNAVGTGPFKLVSWQRNQVIVMVRNDAYWRTPAQVKQVNIVKANDIASRELMLLAGDADTIAMPRDHQYDILNQDKTLKYDFLNVTMDRPTFDVMVFGMNQAIQASKSPDPLKIPTNFFADLHIRKAFSYAFNYNSFIQNVVYGGGVQLRGPVPQGMAGFNDSITAVPYDLSKVESELKLAINPSTSTSYFATGFELTLYYNAGNTVRQQGCLLLKQGLEAMNGRAGAGTFTVKVTALDWPVYLSAMRGKALPIFFIGWAPDYADADDYVQPLLASTGTFPSRMGYANPAIDAMVAAAASELDTTKRVQMYKDMTGVAYTQDFPYIWVYQATNFHVQRAWVQGYFYNPMLSGQYFYLWSKA